jgi:hypothetical protein
MTSLMRALTGLARLLTLPLLRGLGGVFLTLAVPTLRAVAGICLVVAAVALASDAGTVTTGGPTTGGRASFHATPVLAHWQSVAPTSLDATRSFVTKRLRPWVWDAGSAPLRLPSFVFFAALGALLGYLGRHRRRVEIFVN